MQREVREFGKRATILIFNGHHPDEIKIASKIDLLFTNQKCLKGDSIFKKEVPLCSLEKQSTWEAHELLPERVEASFHGANAHGFEGEGREDGFVHSPFVRRRGGVRLERCHGRTVLLSENTLRFPTPRIFVAEQFTRHIVELLQCSDIAQFCL